MIVKSRGRDEHCAALRRFFDRIRQYQLRLNPRLWCHIRKTFRVLSSVKEVKRSTLKK